MTVKVDIWSDVACPWCYIGKARFEKALADFEHADQVSVTWHSYLLDPNLPEQFEGSELEYLSQVKGMPADQVQQMTQVVVQNAADEGLEMHFDKVRPANSTKAHLLIQLARRTDGVDVNALEDALFRAHFVDGEVISDPEVLIALAEPLGLSRDVALAALDDAELQQAFQEDLLTARQLGVTGVPFFVLADKYGVSGAQPTEVFGQALDKVWQEVGAKPSLITLDSEPGEACGPDGC